MSLALDGGSGKSGWYVTLDGVMGGRSTGTLTIENNALFFSGYLNVAGGGFANIRRQISSNLQAYEGISIEFETQNGGTVPIAWELQLEDNSRYSFGHAFANPLSDGRRMKVFLSFSNFDKGRRITQQCSNCELNKSSVREVSIYMLFQEGNYSIRIYSIEALEVAPNPDVYPSLEMTDTQAKAVLEKSIESGSSLWNKGYEMHCAVIYESALRSIKEASGVSSVMQDFACAGLRWGEKTTIEKAWAYRRVMDKILGEELNYPEFVQGDWVNEKCDGTGVTNAPTSLVEATVAAVNAPPSLMLDGGAQKSGWNVVLDGVMGGKSSGSYTVEDGAISFSGYLDVDGGGFANIQRQSSSDLSPYIGISIEFDTQNGGSKPIAWELQLSDDSGFSYGHPFANPVSNGLRMTSFLAFEDFDTGRRGGSKCNNCALKLMNIRSIGVWMLFQEGDYEIQVYSIKASKEAPKEEDYATLEMNDEKAKELLKNSIESGASLWNKGYEMHCAVIYESALKSVKSSNGISNVIKDFACAGLNWSEKSTEEKAWAYRRAMDNILGMSGNYPESVQGDWIQMRCDGTMGTQAPTGMVEATKNPAKSTTIESTVASKQVATTIEPAKEAESFSSLLESMMVLILMIAVLFNL